MNTILHEVYECDPSSITGDLYVCTVCGYTQEGPCDKCPICGAVAAAFAKID